MSRESISRGSWSKSLSHARVTDVVSDSDDDEIRSFVLPAPSTSQGHTIIAQPVHDNDDNDLLEGYDDRQALEPPASVARRSDERSASSSSSSSSSRMRFAEPPPPNVVLGQAFRSNGGGDRSSLASVVDMLRGEIESSRKDDDDDRDSHDNDSELLSFVSGLAKELRNGTAHKNLRGAGTGENIAGAPNRGTAHMAHDGTLFGNIDLDNHDDESNAGGGLRGIIIEGGGGGGVGDDAPLNHERIPGPFMDNARTADGGIDIDAMQGLSEAVNKNKRMKRVNQKAVGMDDEDKIVDDDFEGFMYEVCMHPDEYNRRQRLRQRANQRKLLENRRKLREAKQRRQQAKRLQDAAAAKRTPSPKKSSSSSSSSAAAASNAGPSSREQAGAKRPAPSDDTSSEKRRRVDKLTELLGDSSSSSSDASKKSLAPPPSTEPNAAFADFLGEPKQRRTRLSEPGSLVVSAAPGGGTLTLREDDRPMPTLPRRDDNTQLISVAASQQIVATEREDDDDNDDDMHNVTFVSNDIDDDPRDFEEYAEGQSHGGCLLCRRGTQGTAPIPIQPLDNLIRNYVNNRGYKDEEDLAYDMEEQFEKCIRSPANLNRKAHESEIPILTAEQIYIHMKFHDQDPAVWICDVLRSLHAHREQILHAGVYRVPKTRTRPGSFTGPARTYMNSKARYDRIRRTDVRINEKSHKMYLDTIKTEAMLYRMDPSKMVLYNKHKGIQFNEVQPWLNTNRPMFTQTNAKRDIWASVKDKY